MEIVQEPLGARIKRDHVYQIILLEEMESRKLTVALGDLWAILLPEITWSLLFFSCHSLKSSIFIFRTPALRHSWLISSSGRSLLDKLLLQVSFLSCV